MARNTSFLLKGAPMRTGCGVAILALLLGAGCANKTTTTQTGGGATATSGGAQAGGATTAAPPPQGASTGAQAAARVTPEQLDAAMKTVNASNAALGTKLMSGDLPGAAKDAQTLATTFADVERFFAQANKQDAVMLARTARMGASDAAAAATAGDAMKAASARGNMGATCKQCHGVYREGDAQTGYRLKAGVI
jgi:hypothetical protein